MQISGHNPFDVGSWGHSDSTARAQLPCFEPLYHKIFWIWWIVKQKSAQRFLQWLWTCFRQKTSWFTCFFFLNSAQYFHNWDWDPTMQAFRGSCLWRWQCSGLECLLQQLFRVVGCRNGFLLHQRKQRKKGHISYLHGISIAIETKTSYTYTIWPPVVKNLFQHFESRIMSHIDIYMYLDRKSRISDSYFMCWTVNSFHLAEV